MCDSDERVRSGELRFSLDDVLVSFVVCRIFGIWLVFGFLNVNYSGGAKKKLSVTNQIGKHRVLKETMRG